MRGGPDGGGPYRGNGGGPGYRGAGDPYPPPPPPSYMRDRMMGDGSGGYDGGYGAGGAGAYGARPDPYGRQGPPPTAPGMYDQRSMGGYGQPGKQTKIFFSLFVESVFHQFLHVCDTIMADMLTKYS